MVYFHKVALQKPWKKTLTNKQPEFLKLLSLPPYNYTKTSSNKHLLLSYHTCVAQTCPKCL